MKNRLTSGFFHTFFQQRGLIARRVAVLAGALTASICLAAAGDLDPDFASKGMYVYPRPASAANIETRQIIALSRGGYLALGGLSAGPTDLANYGSSQSFALTSSGILDSAFAQGGLLLDIAIYPGRRYVAAKELADGRLILVSEISGCGSPSQCVGFNPGPTYNVQRYLPNGTLDASYGLAGTFSTASHQGNSAILSDGAMIALGLTYNYFTSPFPWESINNRPYTFDAIVTDAGGRANALLAAQFLSQMIRCSPTGTAVMRDDSGPTVEATAGDQIIFAYGSCMLKLNRDGSPDASFGTGGMSQIDNDGLPLTRVLLRKDGSIMAVSMLADGSSYRVTQRLASGAPDSNFGVAGVMAKMNLPFAPMRDYGTGVGTSVLNANNVPNSRGLPALDASDRVLIAGFVADGGPNKQTNYIARFDAQMRLDTSFGSQTTGLAPVGNADLGLFVPLSVAVDTSNSMVFAGYLKTQDATQVYGFRYAEALIRMQADAPASAAGAGSGGCGTVGNARFDPTLWLLAALAMMALALSRRRRSMLPALNDVAIQG